MRKCSQQKDNTSYTQQKILESRDQIRQHTQMQLNVLWTKVDNRVSCLNKTYNTVSRERIFMPLKFKFNLFAYARILEQSMWHCGHCKNF